MKTFVVVILILVVVIVILSLLPIFLGRGDRGAVSATTLFRSHDAGKTWNEVGAFQGGEIMTLDFDARDPSTLIIGTRNRGIWHGKISGEEWSQLPGGVGEGSRIFDILEGGHKNELTALVFFLNRGRVIKYKDGGRTELFFTPLERFAYLKGVITPGNVIRIIGSDGGVFESLNLGSSWRTVSRFREGLVLMAVNPSNYNEMWVLNSRGSLFWTQTAGETWQDMTQNLRNFQGALQPQFLLYEHRTNTLYHASLYGLLRSFDKGFTWDRVELPAAPETLPISVIAVNPADPNKLIVGDQGQLYFSNDGGISWKGIQLPGRVGVSAILIDPRHPENIFIGLGSRL